MSAPTAARRAAYEVVRRVFEHDAWADRSLRSALERHAVPERERGLAQRLAYGAVQRRGTSDELIERLAKRRVRKLDAPILAALRLGIYELLYSDAADHAAVDQAVGLAQGGSGDRRAAGLVNAVLRRAAREREQLLGSFSDGDPASAAVMHSQPLWLAELWWEERGPEQARALLAAANQPPERAFRVVADGSVVVFDSDWEEAERGVAEGRLVPQSRASAAVVPILGPLPGEAVLDLCAGPGIKTTQLAVAVGAGGRVVSVEANANRASELSELCGRVGAGNVEVVVADAATYEAGEEFDRVLVDPPCSGLGTLASRPDARWRRSPKQIRTMAALQKRILARAAASLRPGGRLVYSTCTLSRAENEEVVAGAPALGLSVDPIEEARGDGPYLETDPARDRTDGFFVARFRR